MNIRFLFYKFQKLCRTDSIKREECDWTGEGMEKSDPPTLLVGM